MWQQPYSSPMKNQYFLNCNSCNNCMEVTPHSHQNPYPTATDSTYLSQTALSTLRQNDFPMVNSFRSNTNNQMNDKISNDLQQYFYRAKDDQVIQAKVLEIPWRKKVVQLENELAELKEKLKDKKVQKIIRKEVVIEDQDRRTAAEIDVEELEKVVREKEENVNLMDQDLIQLEDKLNSDAIETDEITTLTGDLEIQKQKYQKLQKEYNEIQDSLQAINLELTSVKAQISRKKK